jgi:hypothetical protein
MIVNVTSLTMTLAVAVLIIVPVLMDWGRRRRLRRVARTARLRDTANQD